MGTQCQNHTDAHGAIKRAGAAAKAAHKVPHVGSQGHHIPDPDHYKPMSPSSSKAPPMRRK
jgi:hypothetical protein